MYDGTGVPAAKRILQGRYTIRPMRVLTCPEDNVSSWFSRYYVPLQLQRHNQAGPGNLAVRFNVGNTFNNQVVRLDDVNIIGRVKTPKILAMIYQFV